MEGGKSKDVKRDSSVSVRSASSTRSGDDGAPRVRFRSSMSLAVVKRLPRKEALHADQSRKGNWKKAPDDDTLWDGEERAFREDELSSDELAAVLRAREHKSKKFSLGALFGRSNYKQRARSIVQDEANYEDPLQFLDESSIQEWAESDSEEDEEDDVLHGQFSPPPADAVPERSALKQRRRKKEKKAKAKAGRESMHVYPDISVVKRRRGASMHRDSLFTINVERLRNSTRNVNSEVDKLDDNVKMGAAAVLGLLLLLVASRVIRGALGLHSAVAELLVMTVLVLASAAAAAGLDLLPDTARYQKRVRDYVDDII